MSKPNSNNNPRDTTPSTFETPKDARKNSGAGKFPLYYSHKSRSGHVFQMDDSPDAESITIAHRSGSGMQVHPDGSMVMTSKKDSFSITYGANRMVITGAHDIVVQGAASLKVDGDYNTTIQGNMNQTVNGDFNMLAANFNLGSLKAALLQIVLL